MRKGTQDNEASCFIPPFPLLELIFFLRTFARATSQFPLRWALQLRTWIEPLVFFSFPFFSCHACAQNTIEPSSLLYPLRSADEVLREPNLNPPGMERKREMVEGKKLRSLPFRTFLFLFLLPPRRTRLDLKKQSLIFQGKDHVQYFLDILRVHSRSHHGWMVPLALRFYCAHTSCITIMKLPARARIQL